MNPTSINRVFSRSKLGRRFTVITVMFLSVLLGIMVYTITTISKEKSNAFLIDMAGRQRMLLQKHINEVFLSSQGITADYTSTRELIRSTLDSLMEGRAVVLVPETGQRLPLPAVPTEGILIKLREQRNHFDKITELADNLLSQSPDDPEYHRKLLSLRAQNSTLIGIADQAVKLLNRHSESNMMTMVKWEAITAFFVTLLGVFATAQAIRASKKLETEIAERKRAEKNLLSTEQMYRQILDSISDMVFVKDQNYRMLWGNNAFRDYYNMTNEELRGILDATFNAPEFTKQYNKADANVLKTGKILDIPEEPVTRHDGQVHLFHTIKAPLFGDNQEVVKLVGVARDITERKKFEKALEALAKGTVALGNQNFFENLVRQLAHNLQVPMVFLAERIEETFPVVHGVAFWHGDHFESKFEYDCLEGPCEKVFDGHPVYFPQGVQELFPLNPTVKALNLEGYGGTPLFNSGGAIVGNLAIMDHKPLSLNAQDQSLLQVFAARAGAELERKRAQEALQESEERYRTLYEDNPSMYFTVARDGKIISVNQFGAQQLGYSVEELIGQPVIGVFLEDDKPLVHQHFNYCLQNPLKLFNWELRKQKKDGNVLWVRETARTIKSKDKEAVVLIVCEDITERKYTEERLRQSEAKETEALRQSDELKSALLSSVSHELRTPLTAMKGSVSNIIGNGRGSKDQEQEEVLKGIDREINYMSHLVDNLLDMSQIEAGMLIPHKEWHLLEDLVEGALRRTAQTSDTRNINIHIPENVPPVFVDALEIQQVLINLLDNAVKYSSPSSPIRIQVRVEPQQITVEASNMGEPIHPQHLERIFDRFYRQPLLRKQPIRGTGLGLAICKGIVEAHGGRIWADSIGREVTITFTIPTTEHMASFSLEGRHKA